MTDDALRRFVSEALHTLHDWSRVPAPSYTLSSLHHRLAQVGIAVWDQDHPDLEAAAREVQDLGQAVRWLYRQQERARYPMADQPEVPVADQTVEPTPESIVNWVFRSAAYCACQPSGQDCDRCRAGGLAQAAMRDPSKLEIFQDELARLRAGGQARAQGHGLAAAWDD